MMTQEIIRWAIVETENERNRSVEERLNNAGREKNGRNKRAIEDENNEGQTINTRTWTLFRPGDKLKSLKCQKLFQRSLL